MRGFRQSELARALRAFKAAGVPVGPVEIVEGKITLHPAVNGADLKIKQSGYLSIREACEYGKFGKSRAYELIAAGSLRVKKNGKTTLVEKKSIDRLLAKLPKGVGKARP